jgi:antirestriction protein ArdC
MPSRSTPDGSGDRYEWITEQILRLLERGVAPWRQPWDGAADMPRNLASRRRYRGVNAFLLHATRIERGYRTPWWATFNQVRGLRGHVRKGERATKIVYWQWGSVGDELEEAPARPVLRHFNVFNLDQCDRLEAKVPSATPAVVQPIVAAERIVAAMPNPPTIHHGEAAAWYCAHDDAIRLPSIRAFESHRAYYATLFHELAHATGHPSRLGRFAADWKLPPFGSPDYSEEELTAEMAAAFLCGEAGISGSTVECSAAYLQEWLRVLQRDPGALLFAASRAQKAADCILGGEAGKPAEARGGAGTALHPTRPLVRREFPGARFAANHTGVTADLHGPRWRAVIRTIASPGRPAERTVAAGKAGLVARSGGGDIAWSRA